MFVKLYRYRIRTDAIADYLAIQKQVDQIYRKHISYRVVAMQNQKDRKEWVEIHWYPDRETHDRCMALINSEPEMKSLWGAFEATLDASDPKIHEEMFEQRYSGDLSPH